MNKFEIAKGLLIVIMLCLSIGDAFLILAGWRESIPQSHKEILFTGMLLWFATLLFNQNSDDDWAGQW